MAERSSEPVFKSDKTIRAAWAIAALCSVLWGASARANVPLAAVRFSGSVRTIESVGAKAVNGRPTIVRSQLTVPEQAAAMPFEVALRMRNFAEFQARVARGEQVAASELASRYLPTADDYSRVTAWLKREGFTIVRTDANRLAVFARGSVAQVSGALQVQFARVATSRGEFTSAISAPALPSDLAPAVLGIHGLQPHIRPQRAAWRRPADAAATTAPYLPAQIAAAYNASGLSVTGRNQAIAVIGGAFPLASDLQAFATAVGMTDPTGRVQNVTIGTGPAASPAQGLLEEASLDVEWAAALAPNATIRFYGFNENDANAFDETYQQIYEDASTYPALHQLSISFLIGESELDRDYLLITAQYMAMLTNAGVTVFASSGDTSQTIGSMTQVGSPASDPSVTGVGGTSLSLTSTGTVASETVWDGSGGGLSTVFARPAWQTGQGVAPAPIFDARQVPDVSAASDPNRGGLVYINGKSYQVGGTSWAAPIWAAFAAMINEARSNAGQAPLGLLNPRIYPLMGTTALRDVTSGLSGSYTASTGYDLCTGVGVPNVAALISALESAPIAPLVVLQTSDRTITPGQGAAFTVAVQGTGAMTYQWQRLPSGATTWTDLTDSATYLGSDTSMLLVVGATYAMNGDSFRCVIANSVGSVTGAAAKLAVNQYGVTTLAGWPELAGSADGVGQRARFNYPGGVKVAASGDIYVTDAGNCTVRKITPDGQVTTIAGAAGQPGSTDGPAAQARLNNPGGLAFDQAGNIYVADGENRAIRKIAPDGTVSTFAGLAGSQGTADGTGNTARFYDPQNIASDPAGNLYVADGQGDTIRKITPAGVVTTLAGSPNIAGFADGVGSAARFDMPTGVAADATGNVYVADFNNHRIRKITPDGTVTTIAGTGATGNDNGSSTVATLNSPSGVAVDGSGNVYFTDAANNNIREITTSGMVRAVAPPAGSTDFENIDGIITVARFGGPADVAVDANGVIYVADAFNDTVRRIVPGTLQAPEITTQPQGGISVVGGQNAVFTLTASGSEPLTYQWQIHIIPSAGDSYYENLQDDADYSGTKTASLTVHATSVLLDGTLYRCVVTNNEGFDYTQNTILGVGGPPLVTGTTLNLASFSGRKLSITAPVVAPGATYTWSHDGVPISNVSSNSSGFVISPVAATDAGNYTVVVANSYGSVTLDVAKVTVDAPLLVNISARADCGVGNKVAIGGFVVTGKGTKRVLIRAVGPTLTTQGIGQSEVLLDPTISVHHGADIIASNDNWSANALDFLTIPGVASQVGATAFAADDYTSSALVATLSPGVYSFVVNGKNNGTGVVLVEVYDADEEGSSATFANISARAYSTNGNGVTIGGFVVAGANEKHVLLRAVGPTLTTLGIGESEVLEDPTIAVHDALHGNVVIASNDNWGDGADAADTVTTAARVGATPLASSDTTSSALLLSLKPGVYSFVASGKGGTSGIVLVEVYDAD